MKWIQVDSDTAEDPAIRRVLRSHGNEGFGALVRLWLFTAGHGSQETPGRAVDERNRPYSEDDLADAVGLTSEKFALLRELCLETEHFDRAAWQQRHEIFIPALLKRADHWTKKKLRSNSEVPPPTVPDKTGQDLLLSFGESGSSPADALMAAWNELTKTPIAKVREMSAGRRRAAARRLKDHKIDVWRAIFTKIAASDFMNGKNDRGWVVSFDWVMKNAENGVKVLEGRYDNRRSQAPPLPQSGRTGSATTGKYAGIARRDGVTH